MRIELFLDGKTYQSAETDEMEAEELAEKIYEAVAQMDAFKVELADGGYLVLGKEALQRAHLIFSA